MVCPILLVVSLLRYPRGILNFSLFYLALSASFRGRSLRGCVLNLPVGYMGYVMKEDKRPFTEEEVRQKISFYD